MAISKRMYQLINPLDGVRSVLLECSTFSELLSRLRSEGNLETDEQRDYLVLSLFALDDEKGFFLDNMPLVSLATLESWIVQRSGAEPSYPSVQISGLEPQ